MVEAPVERKPGLHFPAPLREARISCRELLKSGEVSSRLQPLARCDVLRDRVPHARQLRLLALFDLLPHFGGVPISRPLRVGIIVEPPLRFRPITVPDRLLNLRAKLDGVGVLGARPHPETKDKSSKAGSGQNNRPAANEAPKRRLPGYWDQAGTRRIIGTGARSRN